MEIDLTDLETPITPKQLRTELIKWFYKDRANECQDLLKHFETMLQAGKVVSAEEGRAVLTKESDEVKSFYESEEVSHTIHDLDMFNFYFETMARQSEWTDYYDEPTRKVRYKYEDGMSLVSCVCEAIVEAPMVNVLSLFAEVDLFATWFPNVTSCDIIKQVTPIRGLFRCL
jgi:hypothetical protein